MQPLAASIFFNKASKLLKRSEQAGARSSATLNSAKVAAVAAQIADEVDRAVAHRQERPKVKNKNRRC